METANWPVGRDVEEVEDREWFVELERCSEMSQVVYGWRTSGGNLQN